MHHPLRSLRERNWFKLICGASFQHLPAVRNLALAYALAGADCVDLAADLAVVLAASDGFQAAREILDEAHGRGFEFAQMPLLMISLNDGDDPHFRKAEFNPEYCPSDCSRPCETICPAEAIAFETSGRQLNIGVNDSRCYGCGRCLPVCPIQQIRTRAHVVSPATLLPLIVSKIDAIEIHTQVGRLDRFKHLWMAIAPFSDQLQLIAISCPDGDGLIEYLRSLHEAIAPLPCPLIWQTDGRPMSGDIGKGTTHAAIRLGQKVLRSDLPGYVQLAGGTNYHTVTKLRQIGLLPSQSDKQHKALAGRSHQYKLNRRLSSHSHNFAAEPRHVAGVAYGSYARTLLSPILDQLDENRTDKLSQLALGEVDPELTYLSAEALQPSTFQSVNLEAHPDLLWQAVALANSLTSQLKLPMKQIVSES